MLRTLRAVQFLFTAPLILLMIYVISRMTSPGGDWFRWAALGIGIAWVVSLLRVLRAIIVIGGLAAFIAWLSKREGSRTTTMR
jgi:hypothetical protein